MNQHGRSESAPTIREYNVICCRGAQCAPVRVSKNLLWNAEGGVPYKIAEL